MPADAGRPTPILEAKNLSKKFGELVAVDGIDLTLKAGECLALLGPNGAGKTTTVEMLEGLLAPTSGSLHIFGLSLQKNRRAILERIGVLLQETNLYKRYTVRETLDLFASFYQLPANPDALIRQLNLSDKADVQLKNLSGGQKQRVYIGACLINNPELIFLDEPTTGLDPQSRRSIWDLMASLKTDNRSMLLTTHYMEEAQVLADRIAVIDHGKIIATGTPKELIKTHCGEQVVTFSLMRQHRTIPAEDLGAVLTDLKSTYPLFRDAIQADGFCEMITASPGQTVSAVIQALKTSDYDIQELNMRSGTLEDVFLKLTGRSMRDG